MEILSISWKEFKQKLSDAEIQFEDKVKKFKGEHSTLSKTLRATLEMLPEPLNKAAIHLYESLGDDVNKKYANESSVIRVKEIFDQVNKISHITEDQYTQCKNKLSSIENSLNESLKNSTLQIKTSQAVFDFMTTQGEKQEEYFKDIKDGIKDIKDVTNKTSKDVQNLAKQHTQRSAKQDQKLDDIQKRIEELRSSESNNEKSDLTKRGDIIYEYLNQIDYSRDFGLAKYPEDNIIISKMIYDDLPRTPHDRESSWYESDEKILGKKSEKKEIAFEEILTWNTPRITILGATYGNGKTTLMRYYNKMYLEQWNQNRTNMVLPLFVPLSKRSQFLVNYQPFEEFIKRNVHDFQILLILDGLDEYADDRKELILQIQNLLSESQGRLHVVITTRLEADLPENMGFLRKYIRLLPFTPENVHEFFKNKEFTFENLEKIGLKYDEITKPLFCKMIKELDVELENHIKSNTKIKRAALYRRFIHKRLFLRDNRDPIPLEIQIKEKQILRKIAALKTIFKDLSYDDILTKPEVHRQNKLRIFYGNEIDNNYDQIHNITKNILTTYFSHYDKKDSKKIQIIDFLHKSFREYLLAEHFIESVVLGKMEYLCVGKPSVETIDFMIEIIESIKDGTGDELESFLKTIQTNTDSKFIIDNPRKYIMSKLIENSKIFVESNRIIYFNLEDNKEFQWSNFDSTLNTFENIWMYRWISLVIQSKLRGCQEISKQNLTELIVNSSRFTFESFRDFNSADLSNADLSNANLRNADLSNANLRNADLSNANLRNADLSNANLSYAKLAETDLSNANLRNADLSNANLSATHLHETNFSYADLSGAGICYTSLESANFSNANLSSTLIQKTEFSPSSRPKTEKVVLSILDKKSSKEYKKDIIQNLNKMDEKFRKAVFDDNPLYEKIYESKNL